MVLYAVYHGGSLATAIKHRLLVQTNKYAILLIGNTGWHIGKNLNIDNLSQIFDKVVGYPASYGFCMNQESSVIEQKVMETYNEIFNENNIDFSEFEFIYNFEDGQDSLGAYFSLNKIKYQAMEELPGRFNKFAKDKQLVSRINEINIEYADFLIKNRVYEFYNNAIIIPVHYEEYNELLEITKLDRLQKNKIINSYGCNVPMGGKYTFFFPSSIALVSYPFNRNVLFAKYFKNVNSAYYFTNAIVIDSLIGKTDFTLKAHPSNPKCLKNDSEIKKLDSYYPTDFLSFFDNIEIDAVYGFGSASIKRFGEFNKARHICSISNLVYEHSFLIYKTLIALHVVKYLEILKCNIIGINHDFFEGILNFSDFKNELVFNRLYNFDEKHSFIVIDNTVYKETNYEEIVIKYIANLENDQIAIVLDSEESLFVLEKNDLQEYVVPIRIQKHKISEDAVGNLGDEKIYAFCKDANKRKLIKQFGLKKVLKFTGIELCVEPISDEQLEIEKLKLVVEHNNIKYDNKILEIKNSIQNMKDEMKKNDNYDNSNNKAMTILLEDKIREKNIKNENLTQQINKEKEVKKILYKEKENLLEEINKLKNKEKQLCCKIGSLQQKYEIFEGVYTDGLIADFIKIINKKYPIGSKKRERVKKFVNIFIKK